MKKNTKRLLVFIVVTVLLFALAACSTVEKKYVYNYVGGEDIIVDGTRGEGEGAFDNVGIYTEPELDIDGVRDSQYDSDGSADVPLHRRERGHLRFHI